MQKQVKQWRVEERRCSAVLPRRRRTRYRKNASSYDGADTESD